MPGDQIEAASFADEDWYGEDLADRSYLRCGFSGVDLTEAVSRRARFAECSFRNVRLNSSRHTDSAFLRCTFNRCNFFEAEFTGCKLVGSTFHESTLRPLRVSGGDWSFVGLARADLRGVRIHDVRMREVDLTGADCTGAAIIGADLSGAQLRGVRLGRCDLRGSDLGALDPTAVELAGAIIGSDQAITIAPAPRAGGPLTRPETGMTAGFGHAIVGLHGGLDTMRRAGIADPRSASRPWDCKSLPTSVGVPAPCSARGTAPPVLRAHRWPSIADGQRWTLPPEGRGS